ncbi:C45 family peptidase [Paenibacillus sanfengchensis]|uniref:C45 family peptidase n=1 Tax=Paenibacillus sanfengchensis TaxID=3119819 RepID=UPI002FE102BC
MRVIPAYFSYLEGDSYAVGQEQGEEVKSMVWAKEAWISSNPMGQTRYKELAKVMDAYAPGLSEEIQGFADSLNVEIRALKFFDEAYLKPGGCSLAAVLPSKASDRKTYVLRNYDLSPEISDMRLCSTNITGKYSHSGFSVSCFGRSDGLNEKGLSVAFASCGIPVGMHPGMKKPVSAGLQFMVIVRALLENCKNVEEGIFCLKDMPIGANMNLLLADIKGEAAVVETYDGKMAIARASREAGYISATNHAVLPGIEERGVLRQSKVRYDLIHSTLGRSLSVSKQELRDLTLREYPEGITVHNYKQNFGTVHSVLFDLHAGQLEFSFGSPLENETYSLKVGERFPFKELSVRVPDREYGPEFWAMEE